MPKKLKKKPVKKTAKRTARKPARKAVPKKKAAAKKPAAKVLKPIGKVTHFYAHIKVAVAKFTKPPKLGAEVNFKGATTDFKQKIESAQYEHKPLKVIPKGKLIGLKVRSRVRQGDLVYLV